MAIDVEELYQRYGPMVIRRCRKLLQDDEQAYDAAQDVFVKLIRYQGSLDDRYPSSLLYRMATNVCLNRIRSSKRKPMNPDSELLVQIATSEEFESQSIAKKMIDSVFKHQKESTRTIAVLHLVDGLTLEEVAKEVGMSVSGVRKRLRALKQHVQELKGV